MAYEILNNAQVTPHRLHALLRLVAYLKTPTRQDLYDLLQPHALSANKDAAEAVFTAARRCQLVTEDTQAAGVIRLAVEADDIASVPAFRACMQRTLLGVTDEAADNHLLNLYAAWYAVQDERVFAFTDLDFDARFNREIGGEAGAGDDADRRFNSTKLNGWQDWAAFVGWGYLLARGRRAGGALFVPDATERLRSVMPTLLPPGERLPFGVFAARVSDACPELDGGELFNRCWQASRQADVRGQSLSLMLSTGLRVLHDEGVVQLIRDDDATDVWLLYEATGRLRRDISHIARGQVA